MPQPISYMWGGGGKAQKFTQMSSLGAAFTFCSNAIKFDFSKVAFDDGHALRLYSAWVYEQSERIKQLEARK